MPHRIIEKTNRREFLNATAKSILALSLGSIGGCSGLAHKNPHALLAGVAKRKITPPISIPYLTSSGNGTCAPFTGFHDDLFARALVLSDGNNAMAVLAIDSIGYDNLISGKGRHFTRELRRRIARDTALRPEHIMLTATHAHSTPETIGLTNFHEVAGVSDWLEQHLEELASAVVDAAKQTVPAQIRFGKTTVNGIARNRRIVLKNGTMSRYGPLPAAEQIARPCPLDEELSVLSVERSGGVPHAVLLNYTAHPVVTMLLPKISADYPGAATALIEKEFPGAICLFTQGAAGNINSVSVSSKHEDATLLGEKLGRAAVSTISKLKSQSSLNEVSLNTRSKKIFLEPRHCPSLRDAEKVAAAKPTSANLRTLRLAQKLADGPLEAEIHAMQLGPVTWISLPGEPFVETGLALKNSGASFVCGYSNGWLGYFPIRRAYDEGGYEVDLGAWSRVAPGTAEVLQMEGEKLLNKLPEDRPGEF